MEDSDWSNGPILLLPADESHREGLRVVFDPADPVWDIYPVNLSGDVFDVSFDAILKNEEFLTFVTLFGGSVVGITRFINLKLEQQTLEIGGTFMADWVRGTGLNARVKAL
jgi:predicted GNAT family acetyltransferase